jgi:hypothetical protein
VDCSPAPAIDCPQQEHAAGFDEGALGVAELGLDRNRLDPVRHPAAVELAR